MNWKIYKTYLKKWQPFILYVNDGKLIPTSDMNNPIMPTNMYWVKETNTYPKIGPYKPETIAVPIVRMKTEHIDDYFKINFPAYFEECSVRFKDFDCYMHLIIKHWDDGTSEVGLCAWHGTGEFGDEELQKHIDRYIKLIIFS